MKPGPVDQTPGIDYVLFLINRRSYAFPLMQVERIVRLVAFSRVPGSPSWMLGVINLSGTVIPVLDIRQRFGIPCRTLTLSDRLLILKDEDRQAAIIADQVNGVFTLPEGQLLSIPGVAKSANNISHSTPLQEDHPVASLVRGVLYHNEMLIMVLDAVSLFQALDMPQIQNDVFSDQALNDLMIDPRDLTQIHGIGAGLSKKLNSAGIHSISDLARAHPEQIAALLKFSPRRLPEIRSWIAESAKRAHQRDL